MTSCFPPRLRSERAARRTEIAEDLLRPVAMLSSQLGAEAGGVVCGEGGKHLFFVHLFFSSPEKGKDGIVSLPLKFTAAFPNSDREVGGSLGGGFQK